MAICIDPRKTALLVIDVQNDWFEKGALAKLGLYKTAVSIIDPLEKLLRFSREIGMRVIFTKHVYRSDCLDAPLHSLSRVSPSLIKGTWGADIIDALKPQAEEIVIEKHRYSAFYNTDLEILLRGTAITTLILTGIVTDVCVMATAIDAQARDFELIVVSDCTMTYDDQREQIALSFIKNNLYGKTLDHQEIMKILQKPS